MLPPAQLPPAPQPAAAGGGAAEAAATPAPLELSVPGSGVYRMHVFNTNVLKKVTFSARVEHEPTVERNRNDMRAELESRRSELAIVEYVEKSKRCVTPANPSCM